MSKIEQPKATADADVVVRSRSGESSSSSNNLELPEYPRPREGEVCALDPAELETDLRSERRKKNRKVGWKRTSIIMMKTQIGVGVLSLPQAFGSLGLIPGIIILLIVASITTWSDYMVGQVKLHFGDEVYGLEHAMEKVAGRWARHFWWGAKQLYYIFTAASLILSVSTGLNALSGDWRPCTAVYVAVGAVVGFVYASIRTLDKIGCIAWVGLGSMIAAICTVSIASAIQHEPGTYKPENHNGTSWADNTAEHYVLIGNGDFVQVMTSISTIIFAFTGTPYFFSIMDEMREPKLYKKSMFWCQGVVTSFYLLIAVMVYYFNGTQVASPALGTAGPVIKMVAYGIALPGLIATTTIVCHMPSKDLYYGIFGSKRLGKWQERSAWYGTVLAVVVVAYLIANTIPKFSNLISIIGALFGVLIVLQPYPMMWFKINWSKRNTPGRPRFFYLMALGAALVFIIGCFCTVAGSYSAVETFKKVVQQDSTFRPWSCVDNSAQTN